MDKVLVLMRGIPGSGKSTLAQKLAEDNNGVIFSTDNFFMVDGEYKFDRKYIGDAHTWNRLNVFHAMRANQVRSFYHYIIIDNTNTQYWEMELYIKMAFEFGYDVAIEEPDNPDKFDVELCSQRNKHGVSKEVIQKMKDRWETTSSIYDKIVGLYNQSN